MKRLVPMFDNSGARYSIPEDRVDEFRADMGEVAEARRYRDKDGRHYTIPQDQDEAFRADMPDAVPVRSYTMADGTRRDFTMSEMSKFLRSKEYRESEDYTPPQMGSVAGAAVKGALTGAAEGAYYGGKNALAKVATALPEAAASVGEAVGNTINLGGNAKNAVGDWLRASGQQTKRWLGENIRGDKYDENGNLVMSGLTKDLGYEDALTKIGETAGDAAAMAVKFAPAAVAGPAYMETIMASDGINAFADTFDRVKAAGYSDAQANLAGTAAGLINYYGAKLMMKGGAATKDIANPLLRALAGTGFTGAATAAQAVGNKGVENAIEGKPITEGMLGAAGEGFVEGAQFHLINEVGTNAKQSLAIRRETREMKEMRKENLLTAIETPEGRAFVDGIVKNDGVDAAIRARKEGKDVSRKMGAAADLPDNMSAAERNAVIDGISKAREAQAERVRTKMDDVQAQSLADEIGQNLMGGASDPMFEDIWLNATRRVKNAAELDEPGARARIVGEAIEDVVGKQLDAGPAKREAKSYEEKFAENRRLRTPTRVGEKEIAEDQEARAMGRRIEQEGELQRVNDKLNRFKKMVEIGNAQKQEQADYDEKMAAYEEARAKRAAEKKRGVAKEKLTPLPEKPTPPELRVEEQKKPVIEADLTENKTPRTYKAKGDDVVPNGMNTRLGLIREDVAAKIADIDPNIEIVGIDFHGSRLRGDNRKDSDLDAVVEFKGDWSESSVFDALHGKDILTIDGVKVDINPIRADKTGNLEDYMRQSRQYDFSKEFEKGAVGVGEGTKKSDLSKKTAKVDKETGENAEIGATKVENAAKVVQPTKVPDGRGRMVEKKNWRTSKVDEVDADGKPLTESEKMVLRQMKALDFIDYNQGRITSRKEYEKVVKAFDDIESAQPFERGIYGDVVNGSARRVANVLATSKFATPEEKARFKEYYEGKPQPSQTRENAPSRAPQEAKPMSQANGAKPVEAQGVANKATQRLSITKSGKITAKFGKKPTESDISAVESAAKSLGFEAIRGEDGSIKVENSDGKRNWKLTDEQSMKLLDAVNPKTKAQLKAEEEARAAEERKAAAQNERKAFLDSHPKEAEIANKMGFANDLQRKAVVDAMLDTPTERDWERNLSIQSAKAIKFLKDNGVNTEGIDSPKKLRDALREFVGKSTRVPDGKGKMKDVDVFRKSQQEADARRFALKHKMDEERNGASDGEYIDWEGATANKTYKIRVKMPDFPEIKVEKPTSREDYLRKWEDVVKQIDEAKRKLTKSPPVNRKTGNRFKPNTDEYRKWQAQEYALDEKARRVYAEAEKRMGGDVDDLFPEAEDVVAPSTRVPDGKGRMVTKTNGNGVYEKIANAEPPIGLHPKFKKQNAAEMAKIGVLAKDGKMPVAIEGFDGGASKPNYVEFKYADGSSQKVYGDINSIKKWADGVGLKPSVRPAPTAKADGEVKKPKVESQYDRAVKAVEQAEADSAKANSIDELSDINSRARSALGNIPREQENELMSRLDKAWRDNKGRVGETRSQGKYTPPREITEAQYRIERMPTSTERERNAKKKAQKDWLLSSVDAAIRSHNDTRTIQGKPYAENFADEYENLVRRRNATYKTEALKKLNEQIKAAGKVLSQGDFIEFDVPADGKFKVHNNPEALALFKRMVQKRLSPTSLKEGTLVAAERPLANDVKESGIGEKVGEGEGRKNTALAQIDTATPAQKLADPDFKAWARKQGRTPTDGARRIYDAQRVDAVFKVAKNWLKGVKMRRSENAAEVPNGARMSIGNLYTGSAADYEKPSLLKVGTGEGTANEAWGLYATEAPGVAGRYASQDVHSLRNVVYKNGIKYEWDKKRDGMRKLKSRNTPESIYLRLLTGNEGNRKIKSHKEVIDILRKNIELAKEERESRLEIEPSVSEKEYTDALRFAEEHGSEYEVRENPNQKHSYVYEQTMFTDRPEGDMSHLIDWDANVGDRIISLINRKLGDIGHVNNGKGVDVYNSLSVLLGGKKPASEFLRDECDIDGIVYDAPTSEGYGHGNYRNYVSFRDDNIRVDHKWVDGKIRYLYSRDGNVVGWYDRAKKELVTLPGADAATVAHELGWHATYDYAQAEAAQGRTALLDKLNDYAANAPQAVKNEILRKYGMATDAAVLLDEIGAARYTMDNVNKIKDAATRRQTAKWYQRTWNAIADTYKAMLSKLGWNKARLDNLSALTPEETVNLLADEMLKGRNLGKAKFTQIDMSKGESIEQLHDRKLKDRLRPIEEIEKDSGKSVGNSAYTLFRLLPGKVQGAIDKAQNFAEKVKADCKKAGIKIEELNEFLYASAASERNAKVLARNGRLDGSAMSHADIQRILSAYRNSPKYAELRRIADDVLAFQRKGFDFRRKAGLISDETWNTLLVDEPNHVPMKNRFDPNGEHMGFSLTEQFGKPEWKTAEGRTNVGDGPLEWIVQEYVDAFSRGHENVARRALLETVLAHPEVGEVKKLGPNDALGEVKRKGQQGDPNVFVVKTDGDTYQVKLNGTRGELIARAVSGRGLVRAPQSLQKAMRWWSAAATSWSPTFAVRNFLADTVDVFAVNIGEKGLIKGLGASGKHVKTALKLTNAIRKYASTGETTDPLIREAVDAGVLMGGGVRGQAFADAGEEALKTLKTDWRNGKNRVKAVRDAMFGWIDTLNQTAELMNRMADYKLQMESLSKANNALPQNRRRSLAELRNEAALHAREITVDFNEKGELTPVTNMLYMFSNSTLGANMRLSRAIYSTKGGKSLAAGFFVYGLIEGAAEAMANGDDEDGKNMNEYTRANSFYFRKGKDIYRIPLHSSQLSVIKYAGNCTARKLFGTLRGDKAAEQIAKDMIGMMTSYLGIGALGDNEAAAIAPTIVQPFIQAYMNRDFADRPIERMSFSEEKPKSGNGRPSTPQFYHDLAKWLNEFGGGNAGRKGEFLGVGTDFSPEMLKHFSEATGKNALRDIENTVEFAKMVLGKTDWDRRNIPVGRDYFRTTGGNDNRFFEAVRAYKTDASDFKERTGADRKKFEDSHPWLKEGRDGRTTVNRLINMTNRDKPRDGVEEMGITQLRKLTEGKIRRKDGSYFEPNTPVSDELKEKAKEWLQKRQARVIEIMGK